MSDETAETGAPAPPFIFPENPQDAKLELTITVQEIQGEGLLLSATATPGGETWEHQAVEEVFRNARTAPQPGTYQFETSPDSTYFVSGPEEVTAAEGRDLAFFLAPVMSQRREQFVKAIETFPTAEGIRAVARDVVGILTAGSFDRSMLLDSTPVVDARKVEVKGVDCIHCGFGHAGIVDVLTGILSGRRPEGMKLEVIDRDGAPVVQVGYLSHNNDFAVALNIELARRLKVAIETVVLEVMTEALVSAEANRRMNERTASSILATYAIDPAVITARVDALENEARAQLAGSQPVDPEAMPDGDAPEDSDDAPDDEFDDDSPEPDALAESVPQPA